MKRSFAVGVIVALLASAGLATPAAASPAATARTGTVQGTLTAVSPDGDRAKNHVIGGATVTAYEFDFTDRFHDTVLSKTTTVTDAKGHYVLKGLPDEVDLKFDVPDVFGHPTSRWYEEDNDPTFTPHGTDLYVSASAEAVADATIGVPGAVSGIIRCAGCTLPPASELEVHLIADQSNGAANSVSMVHPDATGRYSFPDVLPWKRGGGYQIAVRYDGAAAIAPLTTSGSFTVAAAQTLSADVSLSVGAPAVVTAHGGSGDAARLGGVVSMAATSDHSASVAAGATVAAYLLDADSQYSSIVATATANSRGEWAMDGLVGGDYALRFEYTSPTGRKAAAWLGDSAASPPYGVRTSLPARAFFLANQALVYTATVTGHISCEQCATPVDPAFLDLELLARNSPANAFGGIRKIAPPAADGSFRIDGVLPGAEYEVQVTSHSPDASVGHQATSAIFTLTESGTATADAVLPSVVTGFPRSSPSVPDVYALYWDYLHRRPSQPEASFWVSRLDSGLSTSSTIARSFVESDEYRLLRIDAAYQSILGRGADPAGRADWLRWMQQGTITTDDIETSFYASAEWYQTHGNTDQGFVGALYSTLLGRSAGASETAFWSRLVALHGRAWVVAQFWDSRETIAGRVSAMYASYLGRVPDAGGLATWVGVALAIGDSGLRAGLTSSDEYRARAAARYIQQ
ncbi:hypothetical protein B7R21_16100 [Subtercola boreus]|uniref:DUF4214 domain-containing protein n=1 Tax=Subtercola boreus TaxID=120213 RepID=A0A3E0VDE1_9MICO|nr:DUF4214 domain-containing protein [Subtercola boreus]RFA07685.1 hypothetical protein B7R21_16100 [Subtercola boreus]